MCCIKKFVNFLSDSYICTAYFNYYCKCLREHKTQAVDHNNCLLFILLKIEMVGFVVAKNIGRINNRLCLGLPGKVTAKRGGNMALPGNNFIITR